jgi:hypothetical protein
MRALRWAAVATCAAAIGACGERSPPAAAPPAATALATAAAELREVELT